MSRTTERPRIGYALSSEEHAPLDLVRHAEMAEEGGFEFAPNLGSSRSQWSPAVAIHQAYLDAGYDHVYLHQVGPDQPGFIEFAARDILPAIGGAASRGQDRKAS
jgi:coenzyme F420-dependent glucose-6-phosphate dehydrogenase